MQQLPTYALITNKHKMSVTFIFIHRKTVEVVNSSKYIGLSMHVQTFVYGAKLTRGWSV